VKRRFSTETPEVQADGKLIELALTNILLNAREAMPEGGDVEVSVAPERDGVCISIKDTGVGIEPKDIPNVFDPFYSTKPEASGLGLTTAHQIISAHKGEIRMISSPGEGTEVRVWLAITQEPVDSWDAGSTAALH
jgi:two-component system sensor histidine kinase HydH